MRNVLITKIECLENEERVTKNFPKFQQLYLELFENKLKVKKECINQEFIPNYNTSIANTVIKTVSNKRSVYTSNKRSTVKSISERHKLYDYEDDIYDTTRYDKKKIEEKKQSIIKKHEKKIPTLQELNETIKANEEDKKRELMFKLHLLKKQYPTYQFPEFTMQSEYNVIKKSYDLFYKQLTIDSSAESYKNYLVGGFMVCEIIFGHFGFDMEGFTQQQLLSMSTYDKLLIELGERTYVPKGLDSWPVEIRLIMIIFFNVVWFITAKTIMKKTKIDIFKMLNGKEKVQSAPVPDKSSNSNSKVMRGPIIPT